MLRAILVDDEPLAVRVLEKKLQLFPNIQVVNSFTNINRFLDASHSMDVDVIFLDIEMQGANGLEVAKQLKVRHPSLMIVFVTAHRDYAFEAFDVEGLDYLLKPVSSERLKKTIDRIEHYAKSNKPLNEEHLSIDEKLEVFYFDQFKVRYKNEWIIWRTEKTRELFSYFLLQQDEPVQRDLLIEVLWPDSDINRGKTNLHTTIYYLRKTLSKIGFPHEIEYYNKSYIFKKVNMQGDFEHFRKVVGELEENQLINISAIEEAIKSYGHGFLVQDDFVWAGNLQLVYEESYQKLLKTAIQYYEKIEPEKAVSFYKLLIQVIPYEEENVKKIIQLLLKMSNHSEAFQIYDQYKQMLKDELDLEPSFCLTDF